MDFEDIKGVGESTAEKLREAGYTPENIIDSTVEEITKKTGLNQKVVEKILLEAGKKEDPPQPETNQGEGEDFLEGENRYLVAAFKKSRHYKTPLTKKGLRESFKRYKKIGVDHK